MTKQDSNQQNSQQLDDLNNQVKELTALIKSQNERIRVLEAEVRMFNLYDQSSKKYNDDSKQY